MDNSAPAIICAIFHQSSCASLTAKTASGGQPLAAAPLLTGRRRKARDDLTATGRPIKGFREDRKAPRLTL
jgi:hypothetical protein